MFQHLSNKLQDTFKHLRGLDELKESNLQSVIKEIRYALIEADVSIEVVEAILPQIKTQALGQKVIRHINPEQAFIKIVHQALTDIMGNQQQGLALNTTPPATILVAGLQGSGKTTTVAKIALMLKNQKKKVLIVSTDTHRPAAIDQLASLAEKSALDFFPSTPDESPKDITRKAVEFAKKQLFDVLIIDTAGRLHIDETMMTEVKTVHSTAKPSETLLVIDSMLGQEAASVAKHFDHALALTGVVLTKIDGDSRGGAALSVRHVTGKPIKLMGTGESIDAIESFHPERVASRILDMGDILTLVEEAEQKIDKEKSARLLKKIKKNKGFSLNDFRDQILEMEKMGGLEGILNKLPGMGKIPPAMKNAVMNNNQFKKTVVMIDSMTFEEREFPNKINGSRKKRIASGSGTTVQEINQMLKQFMQMQKMMKKGTMNHLMRMMPNMGGKMPPFH